MSKGAIIITVVVVAGAGVGVALFLSHRAKVNAVKAATSGGGASTANKVISVVQGAIPLAQSIVKLFNN